MLRERLRALLVGVVAAGSLATVGLLPTPAAAAHPRADECAPAPNWTSGSSYRAGDVVRYTDGSFHLAKRDNPGYNPVVSTRHWSTLSCDDTAAPAHDDFVVSEAQFDEMFPKRNPFYTYEGLTDAMKAFPKFARTGNDTMRKQEAAAFLANISHETAGLYYIKEVNEDNYPHYCDRERPYGCPAGQDAYYGRGPIQLSWNFNYKTAGDWLGIDLLNDPWKVERDPAVAMMTALWYWNTQNGPGPLTGHDAMVSGAGFGQTIRSINGLLECDGGNPHQVENRVRLYKEYTEILGVPTGPNLSC
ncbi:chitinase [Streptomyces sp. AJS327]|uniref:chitinase n=1 Tax=Streptomyces sp. AJS327 TaxID=2545265 RepID=UPI0015DF6BFC|nr:chitinase [Streptomyces sp. AJS327]MBA0052507.1 chitinase [Streptomyces sp. AJS327]